MQAMTQPPVSTAPRAALYVRISPTLFTVVHDLGELSNLSQVSIIEVMIAKAAGLPHPHRARYDRAVTEYRKANR